MILSSLVNPDPGGFVRLDENLGRHVGPQNVQAFHDEAGDVTINEFLNNPVIARVMLNNAVIMEELNNAIYRHSSLQNAEVALRGVIKTEGGTGSLSQDFPSLQARAIVANELLINPVINDITMRDPVIMDELNRAVTNLYAARQLTPASAQQGDLTKVSKRAPKGNKGAAKGRKR